MTRRCAEGAPNASARVRDWPRVAAGRVTLSGDRQGFRGDCKFPWQGSGRRPELVSGACLGAGLVGVLGLAWKAPAWVRESSRTGISTVHTSVRMPVGRDWKGWPERLSPPQRC
jgi:hypothetical protein